MLTPGYEPRFDRDYAFGRQAELLVDDVLGQVAAGQGRVETKHSRYRDLTLYVELEQKPRGAAEFKPSGLNVTEAEYWAFVKPGALFVLVPVHLLRGEVERRLRRGQRLAEERDGDNPTRGLLVPTEAFLRLPEPTLFDQERAR